jgi:hypothetical protein
VHSFYKIALYHFFHNQIWRTLLYSQIIYASYWQKSGFYVPSKAWAGISKGRTSFILSLCPKITGPLDLATMETQSNWTRSCESNPKCSTLQCILHPRTYKYLITFPFKLTFIINVPFASYTSLWSSSEHKCLRAVVKHGITVPSTMNIILIHTVE